jgi:hypothetical protein
MSLVRCSRWPLSGARILASGRKRDLQSAHPELIKDRAEVERLKDTLYVDLADELLARLAV